MAKIDYPTSSLNSPLSGVVMVVGGWLVVGRSRLAHPQLSSDMAVSEAKKKALLARLANVCPFLAICQPILNLWQNRKMSQKRVK